MQEPMPAARNADTVQKHAAENHDGVAGMDVTACTGSGNADGHSGHTGQSRKEADSTSF